MRVGIDLGTTYSVVAKYNSGTSKAEIIRNKYGRDLTPSVICFDKNGETIIGDEAKEMQKGGAEGIASVFKTSMGTKQICAERNGREYTAGDLSTLLLKEVVRMAETSAGEKVESAVITVPAYFNDLQRNATKDAAESAGLCVAKIINEPTAAAVYYGYKHSDGKTVLVFDLGGGTFDVTVVRVEGSSIVVKGTKGNHNLGGKDWDESVMNYLCDRFCDEFGYDPRRDTCKRYELLADAEDYKKLLSMSGRALATVSYAGYEGRYTITREEFEGETAHLTNACREVLDELFVYGRFKVSDIDEVLLCGGSTRLPQIRDFLARYGFRNVISHRDTDLAVAKGAAIIASLYSSDETRIRDLTFEDVCSHSLGILSIDPRSEKYTNEIMIPCNTPVPASVTKPFRIEEGNLTDQIEVYMLQGESTTPGDCTVVKREVITGLDNIGKSLVVDITYRYTEEGVVAVSASRNGKTLPVISETVPEDTGWMKRMPTERKTNRNVSKNIAVCVDLSRSMKNNLEPVKDAIRNFILGFSGDFTKFTLIGFGDKSKILCGPTAEEEEILDAVDVLRINRLGRGTDANPFEAVKKAFENQIGAKLALVLTDGIWGKRDDATEMARICRNELINIVAIGFGEADLSFLKQIATIEEGAMFTTLNNLGKTVNTIATAIKNNPTGIVEHFR